MGLAESLLEAKEKHEQDGPLRVLGAFYTDRVQGAWGAPPVVEPESEGERLLVAVLSIPHGLTVPDENAYAALVAEAVQKGEEPPARRECIAVYKAKSFELSDAAEQPLAGLVVGKWPPINPAGLTGLIEMTSSRRIVTHERIALAVAFSVPANGPQWPIQIRYGDLQATLSEAALRDDSRYAPTIKKRFELVRYHLERRRYDRAIALGRELWEERHANLIFSVARLSSLAVVVAGEDDQLGAEDQDRLADEFALFAVESLQKSIDAGFRNLKQLQEDELLNSIRQRADFQQLLESLEQRIKDEAKANGKSDNAKPDDADDAKPDNAKPQGGESM